ncbi:ubiquinone biosynthesis hydrox [Piedraia hortae CBS 480.64]|uniref:Ubiquinone biosynthesis hydrox n=1 Tax=Piedraia hortae CBS 480.64 TaxID=1314780 RepID=A0A6A7BRL0_9PEZI|nr:ubiquinone biosynthesis hydrox [Piedraia hortae CBS 480.64]
MCENNNLTSALLELVAGSRIQVWDKTKVESIKLGESHEGLDLSQWPLVQLSHGSPVATRLLVGADGGNSPVRQFVNIPSPGRDYGQHGVVATLTLDQYLSPGATRKAYQRFLPTGPVALLPLPCNAASLVWSTSPEHAAALKNMAPEVFVAMINAAFRLRWDDLEYMLSHAVTVDEIEWRQSATASTGPAVPSVTAVEPQTRASFPLRIRHADTYVSPRVALVGDAAHTVHPLAGQGLNLGLADADCLARRIAEATAQGMDIGSTWCLDEYTRKRWPANHAMLGAVDKLQILFRLGGPVPWGRGVGMDLLQNLGPVKKAIMKFAM